MTANHLVAESVWKTIASTHSVIEERLSILHFLFGKNFEKATRIAYQRGIKKISGEPTGRSILQCKHRLAARFAGSLGACIEVKVSDEQLSIIAFRTLDLGNEIITPFLRKLESSLNVFSCNL